MANQPIVQYPRPTFPQPDRTERLLAACPKLESVFQHFADERHIPGIAYGVILDGKLIFEHGLGVSNIATQKPATADSVFRIASMTKSFAALAIMQLRDAGQLQLDAPAATYVPDLATLAYPNADDAPITVRQLLCMNVGWPQDDPWADRQLYQSDAALSEFYRAGVTWSDSPGVKFEYSNYAYMLLGRIITNVAEMPAIDYISRRILAPLGMNATVWQASDAPAEQLALGYRWEDDIWKEEALLPSGGDVAAFAGLFTSVRDLTRWVSLFLSAWPAGLDNDDQASTASVLSRASLREMQRVWTAQPPEVGQSALAGKPEVSAGGYGFGLSSEHNGDYRIVDHSGGLPGFGANMSWLPEYGVGIIALSNLTYGSMSVACSEAIKLLLDESQLQPRIQPIAPHLTDAQTKLLAFLEQIDQSGWNDDAAEALFADNFLLDKDKEHRLAELTELNEKHGALTLDGGLEPENWLRGSWHMQGERGRCKLKITMSPTLPPKIQTLRIDSTLPPSADLYATMGALATLITRPTKRAFQKLFAAKAASDALWDQIRIAHILCGDCSVDQILASQILGGDGETWVEFELRGAKGAVEANIEVNPRAKVLNLKMSPK